ncbi:hypothetical protein HQ585_13025 [candidate division KSB1 bacterium]|nr:hypothetical protein [candidate division KSB1 bacterium]
MRILTNSIFCAIMTITFACTKTTPVNVDETEQLSLYINDFNYVKGQYYFIDPVYQENYSWVSKSGSYVVHYYDPEKYITEFHLYKSSFGYDNANGSFEAWAVLNPEGRDVSEFNEEAGDYKGYFLSIDPSEYYFSPYLGLIYFQESIDKDEVLAVAYRDSSDQVVGDLDTLGSNMPMLQLIKPMNPRPPDDTWDLSLKSIYQFDLSSLSNIEIKNIQIYYNTGYSLEKYEPESGKSWAEIFYFDLSDHDGMREADGYFDFESQLFDFSTGHLFFPVAQPFCDPDNSNLPYDKRNCDLYQENDIDELESKSKFVIELQYVTR